MGWAEDGCLILSPTPSLLSATGQRSQTVMYLKSEKQRSETTWQQRTVTIEARLGEVLAMDDDAL